MGVRLEWLKCDYPGNEAIVVGCVIETRSLGWTLFHSTKASQYHKRYDSPAGVDVGVIKFVAAHAPHIKTFAVYYQGLGEIHSIPIGTLSRAVADRQWQRETTTRAGQIRDRVFAPLDRWTLHRVAEPFLIPRIPFDEETRITHKGKLRFQTGKEVPLSGGGSFPATP